MMQKKKKVTETMSRIRKKRSFSLDKHVTLKVLPHPPTRSVTLDQGNSEPEPFVKQMDVQHSLSGVHVRTYMQ